MGQRVSSFGSIGRNRGFSLGSLLVVIAILICVVLPAVKAIPSVLEYFSVRRAVTFAKDHAANRKEVAGYFDKQAQIDQISSVRGEDLDVQEDEGGRVRAIDFSYRTEIPVYGAVSLLITYSGTQH
ncbi:DUF4845 domain-containing protein [Cupriavidus plantarum]|uniref:Uncharacterized protein DUF4845 n=1 Tax=Cupriavidus plantarum TaxID=942865 RepID=A0A316EZY2_9BURK|nr:DUF4845 domain-containing protein [Cupriavidus plantarum]NYH99561.1 hypothetical protein [Cupriavidus plantarum]PWK36773.1 uncharacterized protein DUF4845 [Cupriavidus plantarum]REF02491.1 uncharacterized protein DUF4845 [Cupriavidus plantarum]RLK44658.1 uncharacterized protein DUF4845 [Cupriavidus plantarum]CAG2151131.1 hypothetical protein LMG26296_04872 [Cupriavidus plantarum]